MVYDEFLHKGLENIALSLALFFTEYCHAKKFLPNHYASLNPLTSHCVGSRPGLWQFWEGRVEKTNLSNPFYAYFFSDVLGSVQYGFFFGFSQF